MPVFHKKCLWLALFIILVAPSCLSVGSVRDYREYQAYWIQPCDDDNDLDVELSGYMYDHFSKRVAKPELVVNHNNKPSAEQVLKVRIGVDPAMRNEYSIDIDRDMITLKGKRKSTALWLLYQFISYASETDGRISNEGLNPSVIEIKSTKGNFAFDYRGIYSPSNMDLEMLPMTASHNVDTDWGLWGHNLRNCLGDHVPAEAQAEVGGVRKAGQLCFSSELLYKSVEKYIFEKYGDSEDNGVKFLIMPDDNSIVCQCDYCRSVGNTPDDASPAVTTMAERLARRFPKHKFFISSYLSTKNPPYKRLPSNVGVMISAIDYPMNGDTDKMSEFIGVINDWKRVTDLIYIWDYGRNFDDYLTPYPYLTLMAERIKSYRNLGVRGVFVNGSGYDYSTFDQMQTYVISSLLINPNLSVSDLTYRYLKMHYPKTHDIIFKYYDNIERTATESKRGLPYYGGINDAVRSYLNPEEFNSFFKTLNDTAHSMEGPERIRLNKLLTGLCFTKLELLRSSDKMYDSSLYEDPIITLSDHTVYKDMTNYREGAGDLDLYLAQWDNLNSIATMARRNLLKGKRLRAATPLDKDYSNTTALTDGLVGFATDYHTNWIINSNRTLDIEIPAQYVKPGALLTVSALNAPRWNIGAPASIALVKGGNIIYSSNVGQAEEFGRSVTSIRIPGAAAGQNIIVRISANPEYPKIAIDEIMITNS